MYLARSLKKFAKICDNIKLNNELKGEKAVVYDKISGFSDEISPDIDEQFKALDKLGIKYFEPRGINGKNISVLSDDEVDNLKKKMDKYNIKASSIGSPIGKVDLADDFDTHFKVFKNLVSVSKKLCVRYMRIFSFYHKGKEWSEQERCLVFERLSKLISYARENEVVLLHENEKDIYGDTEERCLDLMENLSCQNFRAVFDPANFVQCGVDTKRAYDLLSGYVDYFHIKDADENGRVVPSGHGIGNIEYLLSNMFSRGYDGYLSIEPHLGSFEGLSDLELGDEMLNLSHGGEGTFTLAFKSLSNILDKIK